MKLRNKKTGEVVERTSIVTLRERRTSCSLSLVEAEEFSSIEQLNDEWEDYEPKEPLIKDKRVRRAVRAWAECCCIPLVKHYLSNGLSCFICKDEEDNEYCLDFTFCINNLEAEHIYSIKELCGEEG